MSKKQFSLADLDAEKACSTPYEFEYLNAEGEGTGVFFSVLGAESETVRAEVSRQIDEERKRTIEHRLRGKRDAPMVTLDQQIENGRKLAAVRLVGWRGITDTYSKENGLKLCMSNASIAQQINNKSDDAGNFMKF